MSLRWADEETRVPLSQVQEQKKGRTPLPWRQLSIILCLQLAEPLTAQVIAPFAPQLIRDIGVTNGDETQVGYYVGLLHSLFFVAEGLTVLYWSRLSDRIGRKPVILTGLFGLSASVYCFGLSKTYLGLVVSRSLSGALNGNAGVLKSMMVEVTDSTNLAQAYAYMPIAWSTGGTLGAYVGGSFSKPVDQLPDVFGGLTFFKTYPYFLACAVPATFTAVAGLVTFLFLKETRPHCVGLGQLIAVKFSPNFKVKRIPSTSESFCETLQDENIEEHRQKEVPLPLRALLVPRVLIAAGNYAALSLLEIAFRTMLPVFFATPIKLGGLGLDPPRIGNILLIFGVMNAVFQAFFFPGFHDRFGSKVTYFAALASTIPAILAFPFINALARAQGLNWAVWFLVGAQLAVSMALYMGFSCISIYIAASSPNRASLGATNGFAQVLVAIVRAIGPATVTSLFSVSMKSPGYAWLAYYYLLAFAFVSIGGSLLLPRKVWG